MKCWNDFTKEWLEMPRYSPTNESLRDPARYWVVSDAEIRKYTASWPKQSRTIDDVYRENRRGRETSLYVRPRSVCPNEYIRWCEERGHTPHPASIDPDHPIAKQRESMRYVKRA